MPCPDGVCLAYAAPREATTGLPSCGRLAECGLYVIREPAPAAALVSEHRTVRAGTAGAVEGDRPGVREGYVSVWTGKRLLIMGGIAGDQLATPIGAGLDPAAGSWKPLGTLNTLIGFVPSGAVWDGKQAFLFGNVSECPELVSSC